MHRLKLRLKRSWFLAASSQGWVEGVPRVTVVLRSGQSAPGLALLLRPWDTQDLSQLLTIYRDPVMLQSSRNPVVTEQDACRWLEVQQQGWADGGRLSFAVLDGEPGSEPGRVLGNVVLKGCRAGSRVAEAGYWTAVAARNRGVASQAVKTLTAWRSGASAHRACSVSSCFTSTTISRHARSRRSPVMR